MRGSVKSDSQVIYENQLNNHLRFQYKKTKALFSSIRFTFYIKKDMRNSAKSDSHSIYENLLHNSLTFQHEKEKFHLL